MTRDERLVEMQNTLNQTAKMVAVIEERQKHAPTWGDIKESIESAIAPLSDDITQRIDLAISRCQQGARARRRDENSGSIKITLKPTSPLARWIFFVVLPSLGAGAGMSEILQRVL